MSRKDIKSWLAKQALWQVHIPLPKEIHHPHYDVTKPNEQHQFDLLYMPHNVASRYKAAKALRTTKRSKVAFALETIYRKGGVFKYPKVFQCDNGPEFKIKAIKLLEKHNVHIRRTASKYKHTYTAVVEAFNKELAKLLFKPMDALELQDPEKESTIWVKNLNKNVNKMNNTISSMIGMNPKDAIKLDTIPLDNPYTEETVKMAYTDIFINLVNNIEIKKDEPDFIWGKNTFRLDRIVEEPGNCVLYFLQDGPDRVFVREELMHVFEDTQAPPDSVSERK